MGERKTVRARRADAVIVRPRRAEQAPRATRVDATPERDAGVLWVRGHDGLPPRSHPRKRSPCPALRHATMARRRNAAITVFRQPDPTDLAVTGH
jgi:hypothetical protein